MTESQRNGELSIQECSDRDAAEWNAAAATLGGSFYHLWQWRQINDESLGHLTINLAARRNGEMVGLLPLVHVQHRVFGRILCSMPFVNFRRALRGG